MNWRTVIITCRCKLDLKLGYMVVRSEDTKRILPSSELVPLYGSHDCSAKIKSQINCEKELKDEIRTLIVWEKIHKQAEHLELLGYNEGAEKLHGYLRKMEFCDRTNRGRPVWTN